MTSLDEFRDDDRGLALGIVVFFAMIIIGALMFIMMDTAMIDVFGFATADAPSQGAQDQITLAQNIWNGILYAVVFISMIFLVARAVNEGSV